MKNDFNKKIQGFIKDLEDASPNTKNTLKEIYPVTFKLNIEGHKDIYISLENDLKAISFSPVEKIDFEMVSSLTEIFELLITKKNKERHVHWRPRTGDGISKHFKKIWYRFFISYRSILWKHPCRFYTSCLTGHIQ